MPRWRATSSHDHPVSDLRSVKAVARSRGERSSRTTFSINAEDGARPVGRRRAHMPDHRWDPLEVRRIKIRRRRLRGQPLERSPPPLARNQEKPLLVLIGLFEEDRLLQAMEADR